jgi:putative acetyltransferase
MTGRLPLCIRPAAAGDASAIVRIQAAAVQQLAAGSYPAAVIAAWAWSADSPVLLETLARLIAGSGPERLVVATRGAGVVGFGSVAPAAESLRAVYVDPSHARCGVGAGILAELEALARAAGTMCLHMDASLNAESFYLRHGYVVRERAVHVLASGQPMACVRMRKQLIAAPT